MAAAAPRSWPATSRRSGGCWPTARAGRLFPTGDPGALADALREVLDDADLRARLVAAGTTAPSRPYDWSVIVAEVLRVYELAIAGTGAPL